MCQQPGHDVFDAYIVLVKSVGDSHVCYLHQLLFRCLGETRQGCMLSVHTISKGQLGCSTYVHSTLQVFNLCTLHIVGVQSMYTPHCRCSTYVHSTLQVFNLCTLHIVGV